MANVPKCHQISSNEINENKTLCHHNKNANISKKDINNSKHDFSIFSLIFAFLLRWYKVLLLFISIDNIWWHLGTFSINQYLFPRLVKFNEYESGAWLYLWKISNLLFKYCFIILKFVFALSGPGCSERFWSYLVENFFSNLVDIPLVCDILVNW